VVGLGGILQKLLERQISIENRLVEIEKILREERADPVQVNVPESRLLQLPDHLRKTYVALCGLKEGSARDVAVRTGRSRAVESHYLNTLALSNWAKKTRRSRTQVFTPK